MKPTKREPLVKVDECIKYIESCGYMLITRKRGYYHFRKPSARPEFRDMTFSLADLRLTYRTGW